MSPEPGLHAHLSPISLPLVSSHPYAPLVVTGSGSASAYSWPPTTENPSKYPFPYASGALMKFSPHETPASGWYGRYAYGRFAPLVVGPPGHAHPEVANPDIESPDGVSTITVAPACDPAGTPSLPAA